MFGLHRSGPLALHRSPPAAATLLPL